MFGYNGIGKTTISILLAKILSEKNQKVLLVDSKFNNYNIYKILNKNIENN
ncbi:MAG: ParA family protein, partial [Clostridia bacterium]